MWKKMSPESVSNLAVWIKLMKNLLAKKFYVAFIDGFTINRKTLNTYGWTRRGLPGRLLIRTLEFKMSFIVAYSQICIDNIMGTKDSFNQMKYKIFLQELLKRIKKEQKLIWISSSSSQIIEFFTRPNWSKTMWSIRSWRSCLFLHTRLRQMPEKSW